MPDATLKVIEREGWSKVLPINKALLKVGSASICDVQIPIPGVPAVQVQVMSSPEHFGICRATNLGPALEIQSAGGTRPFPQYSTTELQNADQLVIADYTLQFNLPPSAGQVHTSRSIEASLQIIEPVLRPDFPLEGVLTVKNLGAQRACQFQVALSGLPEDCFYIDPIPLIYPSAAEEVRVQFFHHTITPPAGACDLLLAVSAPNAYPGEKLLIQQQIYVTPVLAQTIEINDDLARPEKLAPRDPAPDAKPAPSVTPQVVAEAQPPVLQPDAETAPPTPKAEQAPARVVLEEPVSTEPPALPNPPETPVPQPQRSRPELKVAREQTDEFWDQ